MPLTCVRIYCMQSIDFDDVAYTSGNDMSVYNSSMVEAYKEAERKNKGLMANSGSDEKKKIKISLISQSGIMEDLGRVAKGKAAEISADIFGLISACRLGWTSPSEGDMIDAAFKLCMDYLYPSDEGKSANILVISDNPNLWRNWWEEDSNNASFSLIALDENLQKQLMPRSLKGARPALEPNLGRLSVLSYSQLNQLRENEAADFGLNPNFPWALLIIDGLQSMQRYEYDASTKWPVHLQDINLQNELFLLPDSVNMDDHVLPSKQWQQWVQNEEKKLKDDNGFLSPEMQQEFWNEKHEKTEGEIQKARKLFASLEPSCNTLEEKPTFGSDIGESVNLDKYIAPLGTMSYSESSYTLGMFPEKEVIEKLIDKFSWGKKFLISIDGDYGAGTAYVTDSNISLWPALSNFFDFPGDKLYDVRDDVSNMMQILDTVKNFADNAPSSATEEDFFNLLKKVAPRDSNGKLFVDNKGFEVGQNEKTANNLAIRPSKQEAESAPLKIRASASVLVENYEGSLKRNKNLILHGAPGTGKSYLAKNIAAYLVSDENCPTYKDLNDELKTHVDFIQFHPDYDYSDFVEGYRPEERGGVLGFERKDGLFKEFVGRARKDPFGKYVFIIDEINRGNLSSIFGDLFSILEPGHRGADWTVKLKCSGKDFYIPENVYIVGTLNNIDRSVEPLDFAFRRRWTFKEIKAEKTAKEILNSIEDSKMRAQALERMKSLNDEIKACLGADYQVGGAYFLKLKDNGGSFEFLWDDDLYPLLQDYIRGMEDESLMDRLETAYQHPKASPSDDGDHND